MFLVLIHIQSFSAFWLSFSTILRAEFFAFEIDTHSFLEDLFEDLVLRPHVITLIGIGKKI